MINVSHARTAIEALPGDVVGLSKAQVAQLLTEVEIGQHARRALTNLKTQAVIAASSAGIA